ncbi:abl interactor 2-like [Asterias amurensis]|uniref:abl interactor 2-like n=1 Tax=Asterias amurensis TaxID=7602 RepID=UPI003AB5B472
MSRLGELFDSEIPAGRKALQDSHANLLDVASYCDDNYLKAENKREALAETKNYATQSLASVAYQINTLATSMLQMLDLQGVQLAEMESSINHIARNVSIHKEKVARREIGVLTTNKNCPRTHKIIAPANPEKPMKYKSSPIDYTALDDTGHGMKLSGSSRAGRTPDVSKKRTDSISSTSTMSSQENNFPIYQPVGNVGKFDTWGRNTRRPVAPPNAPVAPVTYAPITRDLGPPQAPPSNQQQQRPPSVAFGQAPPPPSQIGYAPQGGGPPPPPAPPTEPEMHYNGNRASIPQMVPPPMMAPPAMAPPPPPLPGGPVSAPKGASSEGGNSMMMMPPPPPPDMVGGGGDMPPPPPPDMEVSALPPPPPMEEISYPSNMGLTDEMPPPPEFIQTSDIIDTNAPAEYLEKVVAIYDYQQTREDELTFQEDDIIYVLKKNPDGWFEGVYNGVTGLFPGNYVEAVP